MSSRKDICLMSVRETPQGTGPHIVDISLNWGESSCPLGRTAISFGFFHGHAQELLPRLHQLFMPRPPRSCSWKSKPLACPSFDNRRRRKGKNQTVPDLWRKPSLPRPATAGAFRSGSRVIALMPILKLHKCQPHILAATGKTEPGHGGLWPPLFWSSCSRKCFSHLAYHSGWFILGWHRQAVGPGRMMNPWSHPAGTPVGRPEEEEHHGSGQAHRNENIR